jgi:hypothetical protein
MDELVPERLCDKSAIYDRQAVMVGSYKLVEIRGLSIGRSL